MTGQRPHAKRKEVAAMSLSMLVAVSDFLARDGISLDALIRWTNLLERIA
jgi:hypothetical protein